ncbi:unnamed protein product [Hermetia illucens]|uniref:C2H2-type domain-containing protein n=1 Tax=Hermetia illucens TaxID=343691 RepID=A0A7R8V7L1_HERIL|nr:unnamed protein product [Hermetia illucens]
MTASSSVLSMQIQQQQQQLQHHQQQQSLVNPSVTPTSLAVNNNLQQQNHPPQSLTPVGVGSIGGGSVGDQGQTDLKFNNEKLVNEIQLFMHKSAMQQIQHLPRVGLSAGMSAEVKPHQCQQCLKSFSSNHQLVQHIRVHTGEKPYKCSYCDRRFKQLSHVQQHTRLHTGERPYKCHLPECGRAFIQLSNLQQHLRNHDAQVERAKNRPFHCNICGKGFATESSLRTHTSKELQLHLGVLQQHAALIGGPNASTCPICHKLFLGGEALMEHMKHTHKDPNASGVATKRRTANHPCPVCGKHYVNEGSLRKHLACHPETSQLATSLRMWPCSVCQAVFTHEAGLLSHMEHMRMDPKHQFAAQYVLSRAAAERRERDTLLAAAVAASASSSGLLSMGSGGGEGGTNSMCASPSAHSESSSGNGRLSSTGSDPGGNMINNNNNNCNSKLNEILRGGNNSGPLHPSQYGVDDLQANRMSLMAAAAAGIVGQTGPNVPNNLGSPGVDSSRADAVQAAVVNLAAAMRMGQQNMVNNGPSATAGPNAPSPLSNDSASAVAAQAAMNAMRVSMADSMMRSSMVVDPMTHHQSHHHHHQQNSPETALRMHQQAEAILRSQAEVALRLAVSVAASSNGANNGNNDSHLTNNPLRHHLHNGAFGANQSMPSSNGTNQGGGSASGTGPGGTGSSGESSSQQQIHSPQSQSTQQIQSQQQVNPDLSEAIRLQEHRLGQALRLHNDARGALNFLTSSNNGGASGTSQTSTPSQHHGTHNP